MNEKNTNLQIQLLKELKSKSIHDSPDYGTYSENTDEYFLKGLKKLSNLGSSPDYELAYLYLLKSNLPESKLIAETIIYCDFLNLKKPTINSIFNLISKTKPINEYVQLAYDQISFKVSTINKLDLSPELFKNNSDIRFVPNDYCFFIIHPYEENLHYLKNAALEKYAPALYLIGKIYLDGSIVKKSVEKGLEYLEQASNQNFSPAQFELAKMYISGINTPRIYNYAFKLCEKAANNGLKEAQFLLGKMYESGQGTIKSKENAKTWYEKSISDFKLKTIEELESKNKNKIKSKNKNKKPATDINSDIISNDDPDELYEMAKGYLNHPEQKNYKIHAFKCFLKSAKNSNEAAQYATGCFYEQGHVINQSYKNAIYWYKRSAAQGNASAQFCLGKLCQEGKGCTKSNASAVKWYTEAANQNIAEAQLNLGKIFFNGLKNYHSYSDALYWFERASDNNLEEANVYLGIIYFEGLGIEKSYRTSKIYFEKSKTNDISQYYLGKIYQYGLETEINLELAVKYYSESAKINENAQYVLGEMYYSGIGVEKSITKSIELFKKSAHKNSKAQLKLGDIYWYGENTQKSPNLAKWWYKKAYENGNYDAKLRLDKIDNM